MSSSEAVANTSKNDEDKNGVMRKKAKRGISSEEDNMELEGIPDVPGMTGGKDDIGNKYKEFKTQMQNLVSKYSIADDIDSNLELIGSLVMAACTDNSKLPTTGVYEFHVWDDELIAGTTWKASLGLQKVTLDLTLLKAWAAKEVSPREKRGSWYPFLAALQLADKVKDSILWQRNTVTKELGVPPVCEPYAYGHSIKDKLKKSRPLSVGPLVHLLHLKKLDESQTKTGNRGLTQVAYNAIRNRLVKTLKKQSIGVAQKSLIDSISGGKWELVSTLALSYIAIKPRIQNNFALTYPFVYHASGFKDANFSSEWVYSTVKSCAGKFFVFGPEGWGTFMHEIHVHGVFQTSGEDLGLLSWMFNNNFSQRKKYGKVCKKIEYTNLGPWAFSYRAWARPQKGAPVNVAGSGSGQISSRPSLKGKRRLYNKYTKLDDLKKDYSQVASKDFYSAINFEFEKYAEQVSECSSSSFYKPGGRDPVPETEIQTSGIYLFSN